MSNCPSVAETSARKTKHRTWRVGELRFIMPVGPEELILPSSEPRTKGLQGFIDLLQWATLAANRLV